MSVHRDTLKWLGVALLAALASGCATTPHYDYTAFRRAQPRSILVLPPVNHSPEIKASNSVYAWTTQPLAEAGYYVFPIGLVAQTFHQNGLDSPDEIQAVGIGKLREIFGADAALYIDITKYGTRYAVLSSDTVVSASARLVDLRSGELLWQGRASASSAENQGNGGGGLIGALVSAAVNQIIDTIAERGHEIAGIASQRLLAPRPGGILYGPRSPAYGKEDAQAR